MRETFRAVQYCKLHVVYISNSLSGSPDQLNMSVERDKFFKTFLGRSPDGLDAKVPENGKFRTPHTTRDHFVIGHSCIDATRDVVFKFLKKVAIEFEKETNPIVVVVILSGHGATCPGLSTLVLEDKQTISLHDVYSKLRMGNGQKMVIVADTCRSQPVCTSSSELTWKKDFPYLWIIEATKQNNIALQRDGTGQLVDVILDNLDDLKSEKYISRERINKFVIESLKKFASSKVLLYGTSRYERVLNSTYVPEFMDQIHFYNCQLKGLYEHIPQVYCNVAVMKKIDHLPFLLYTGVPVGNIHIFEPNIVPSVYRRSAHEGHAA